MFSKHTKFVKTNFGEMNSDIQKSVTIYRFLWLPIFKSTKEMVDNI
jgi:hypothetical protein